MERTKISGWLGRAWAGAAMALATCLLASGASFAASFSEAGPNGFQVGFMSDSEIEALPSITIDAVSVPFFLSAGVDPSMDVVFTQTGCLLPQGGSICQDEAFDGPATVLLTWEITAINTSEIDGPFTLILEGLVSPLETPQPEFGYLSSEVSVAVNPTLPPGLDTGAAPDFSLDPSSPTGFDPLVLVRDETFGTGSNADLFLGWTVLGIGDAVTFQYDVTVLRENATSGPYLPQFGVAAINVVPEPSTAVLMGLGLFGLTLASRPRS